MTMRKMRGESTGGVVRVSRLSRDSEEEKEEEEELCVMGGSGGDLTPYVWMSERKLLMGLIMDDTIG